MEESPNSRLFSYLISRGMGVSCVSTERRDGAIVLVVDLAKDGASVQEVPVEFEGLEVVVKVSGSYCTCRP